MRYRRLIATGVAAIFFASFGLYMATGATPTNAEAKKRLAYCGSIPNGASLTVVATTRMFIYLPKDIYPRLKLDVSSHEATAGPISNAGRDGYAQVRSAKPGCWSHYYEFDVASGTSKPTSGIVEIRSKSAYKTVSNYLIHFKVVVNPPSATRKIAGNGTVLGHVVLGPVCPVERTPPDPACAPRPYKSSINVWSVLTGSSFKPVSTDASGNFKLSLAPGAYTLAVAQAANGSLYPRCTQVNISVIAKKAQILTISCDTGIR